MPTRQNSARLEIHSATQEGFNFLDQNVTQFVGRFRAPPVRDLHKIVALVIVIGLNSQQVKVHSQLARVPALHLFVEVAEKYTRRHRA